MYRIFEDECDPALFSASDRKDLSTLITRVKDSLLDQKGFLATPVHYRTLIQRSTVGNGEQYGLLAYRRSPLADRRQVLINKDNGKFLADFHVHLGQLTAEELLDTHARDKRFLQHSTGVRYYERGEFPALESDLRTYLLDGLLPPGCVRTNQAT